MQMAKIAVVLLSFFVPWRLVVLLPQVVPPNLMLGSFRQQRASLEVLRRQNAEATYRVPLQIGKEDKAVFQQFLADFYRKIYQQRNELAATLQASSTMTGYYNKLVNGGSVTYEDFWQRYFWRCSQERVLAEWDRKDAERARSRAQAVEQGIARFQKLVGDAKEVSGNVNKSSQVTGEDEAVIFTEQTVDKISKKENAAPLEELANDPVDEASGQNKEKTAALEENPKGPRLPDKNLGETLMSSDTKVMLKDPEQDSIKSKERKVKEEPLVLDLNSPSEQEETLFRAWQHSEDENEAMKSGTTMEDKHSAEPILEPGQIVSARKISTGLRWGLGISMLIALLATILSSKAGKTVLCAPAAPIGMRLMNFPSSSDPVAAYKWSAPWWAPGPLKEEAHSLVCGSKRPLLELLAEYDKKKSGYRLRLVSRTVGVEKEKLLWDRRRVSAVFAYPALLKIVTSDGRSQEETEETIHLYS